MKINPPDAYWKKDVSLFLSRRFALLIKMLYPVAIIAPVAASDIPARYAAAVVGIVAIMAGTFGAGESLTSDLNDGILDRKSTRLNSSHANISYAVFCLKKKKQKT